MSKFLFSGNGIDKKASAAAAGAESERSICGFEEEISARKRLAGSPGIQADGTIH
jgi:hypothetical protein